MKYVCVKCENEFSYEQAFNAHTLILDQKNGVIVIESMDDEWLGERCQICSKLWSPIFSYLRLKKHPNIRV